MFCLRFNAPIPHRKHQESINVSIRPDSWRIVKFSTHSVMFYDSVTQKVETATDIRGIQLDSA